MRKNPIKIVCVSDTHGRHWEVKIPKCDILIFNGDAGITSFEKLEDFNQWLSKQPARYIIFIAGNHDSYCEQIGRDDCKLFFTNAIYLENEAVQIEGIKFWGSPYSLLFNNWSFMKSEKQLEQIWDLIPKKTNIVLTHSPCKNILDVTTTTGESCGSISLRNKIKEIQPKILISGHLHSSHNKYTDHKTDYYNVSILDDYYKYIYEPTVIYYEN